MPRLIPVADRPLSLGGTVEYLTLDEFQKRFRCVFNDGISLNTESRIDAFQENVMGKVSSAQLKRQVEKILRVGYENLVLCRMGDFGYGVFASKNIPKDTVVAIYGGTIAPRDRVLRFDDHTIGYFGTPMTFSTIYHRGIASFMQHLPEEPNGDDPKMLSSMLKSMGQDTSEEQLKLELELYSTRFVPDTARELIAIENIRREFTRCANFVFPSTAYVFRNYSDTLRH
jgi:hypothetical protein